MLFRSSRLRIHPQAGFQILNSGFIIIDDRPDELLHIRRRRDQLLFGDRRPMRMLRHTQDVAENAVCGKTNSSANRLQAVNGYPTTPGRQQSLPTSRLTAPQNQHQQTTGNYRAEQYWEEGHEQEIAMRATGADKKLAVQLALTSDFSCPRLSSDDMDDPDDGGRGRRRNLLRSKPLGDDCHQEARVVTSSGGGTRTPDTRIMIPPADFRKRFPGHKLRTQENPACTTACTEICPAPGAPPLDELTRIVAAWPHLSTDVRAAIVTLVDAYSRQGTGECND